MLALDGGGTRGIVSIAFLERMERVLADRFVEQGLYQSPADFRLAHYFDMIGGTSVGSMLAARLVLGHSVKEIKDSFEPMAKRIFKPVSWGIRRSVFGAGPLTTSIKGFVGDETLASGKVKTGLCIVMKRMDTGSIWPITNNPMARYWEPRLVKGSNRQRKGNRDYKLWELIRSSTAAPRYFSSKKVEIFEGLDDGEGHGQFIDGAVSPHNCPALQMFMMAGIKGYNLGGGELTPDGGGKSWNLGAGQLLLVSVGTGTFASMSKAGYSAAYDAIVSLQGIIADGTDLGITLLQWLGQSEHPWVIDREVRSLASDALNLNGKPLDPLLSFHRYDMKLELDRLNPDRSLNLQEAEFLSLQDFMQPANIPRLYHLAKTSAGEHVKAGHFPAAFDLKPQAVAAGV
jgi:hypothetical protein